MQIQTVHSESAHRLSLQLLLCAIQWTAVLLSLTSDVLKDSRLL